MIIGLCCVIEDGGVVDIAAVVDVVVGAAVVVDVRLSVMRLLFAVEHAIDYGVALDAELPSLWGTVVAGAVAVDVRLMVAVLLKLCVDAVCSCCFC